MAQSLSKKQAAALARAQEKGYQPRQHIERDAQRGRISYVPEVENKHDSILDDYITSVTFILTSPSQANIEVVGVLDTMRTPRAVH
jgi:hypothetical protein